MQKSQAVQVDASRQSCNPILTLGGRVSPGTTLTVLAVSAVGSGLALGWDSIVALGLSTAVISLLPCLAMCAFGVCASLMGKKDADAGTAAATVPPQEVQPPAAETMANAEATAVEKIKAPASGATTP